MSKLIKAFTGNSIVVQHLASLLEEEGIPVFVKDNTQSARLAGFGVPTNSVELYINEEHAEKVEGIVKEFEEGMVE